MDYRSKNRPPHHLGGAHRRSALYSARRAPCEKPAEGARLGWAGEIEASISAASQRHL